MNVEWIILGDHAEVVTGKLYLLGGGWTSLTINSGFPADHHFGIAVSFMVGWTETNQRHDFKVAVSDEDGAELVSFGGQFEVGRPVGVPPGSDQRFQIAANVNFKFERSGTYVITAQAADGDPKRATFTVIPGPMLALRQQAA